MQKRARVIYNPTSGREALKRNLIDILAVFEEAGYETSAYATTPKPNSARDEAKRASLDGFDLIVAAGGDGTINEVVNGIAPLEKRPKLAIIPAGTTNDFARALHIPREDPIEAAKVVLKGQTFNMDIGKAGEKYFMNIAGGGLLTELTYDVPSDLKTIFGYLAYLVRGAELLPRIKPIQMDLEYDGGEFKGKASMFLLAMTNSIGGLEQIVPDAKLDDGKFTMIIVKTSNIVEIVQLLAKVLSGGRHINDPRIIYKKTSKLVANPVEDKMQINLDGEYGGDAPMTFIDLKQHIEMFANVDEMPKKSISFDAEKVEKEFVDKVDKLS
ncbi:diacylglycerol kinase [Apilactobacillus kunkeei]|uniref:diacylglycerol kinase n=1 Tax=Apilactobacillus kunkeei TaxID=148814 RepID=UPI00110C7D4B|nr:diacylglycerol kinase [Apilactobacillus kunkeei]TMT01094.1 diacylglycerol kinase [Apilactobacillus kunkeei]TMT02240.1 diacylglycerol kinase [Apilactobacillus kunkeei]TMT04041.1 diacylglycerol kinase [Apilactobacillus kunkeei]